MQNIRRQMNTDSLLGRIRAWASPAAVQTRRLAREEKAIRRMPGTRDGAAVRWGVFAALVLSLLLALYSGNRILYIVFYVLASLYICALGLCIYTFLGFTFRQEMERNLLRRGESTAYTLTVYNERPFPFGRIRLQLMLSDPESYPVYACALAPQTRTEETFEVTPSARGIYEIGLKTVEVRDSFGLLRLRIPARWSPYLRPLNLQVLPRVYESDPVRYPAGTQARQMEGLLHGSEEVNSVSDQRLYQPGDSLRRINWKLYAHTREAYVRVFDEDALPPALVILDTEKPSPLLREKQAMVRQEVLCASAVTMLSLLRAQGAPANLLVTHGTRQVLHPCRTDAEWEELYRYMSYLRFDGTYPLLSVVRSLPFASGNSRSRMLTYLVTSRLDATIAQCVQELEKRGALVRVLLCTEAEGNENTETVRRYLNRMHVACTAVSPLGGPRSGWEADGE